MTDRSGPTSKLAIALALALFACGDDDAEVDLGVDADVPRDFGVDAAPPDAGLDGGADASPDFGTDLGPPDMGAPTLVDVSHDRELRAMWVASVFNLDFPSDTTLTRAEAEAELVSIVDRTAANGLNAIFFQVRPESDALYASALEPWSRFVSGTQGTNPGYDALALLIPLARLRGLEVHAWVNPFRGLTSTSVTPDPLHPASRFPASAEPYGSGITMNPADPAVRTHVLDVLTDITGRYDIDGVVFDDYFYPYPTGDPFPDDPEYAAYTSGGGTLSKSDWRRANINALIQAVDPALEAVKPWVRWGVSPFGIYRPGMPEGVVGLDAYEAVSADSKRWIEEGWVDYISPQLYWSTISTGQPFGPLIDWWAGVSSAERPVIPTLGLYREGPEWTPAEFSAQVALTRAEGASAGGQAWFRHGSLDAPLDAMLRDVYATPARPPVVPGYTATVDPPEAIAAVGGMTLAHDAPTAIRGYAVYGDEGGAWVLRAWVPVSRGSFATGAGRYAVSVIDHGGVESLGVVVEVR